MNFLRQVVKPGRDLVLFIFGCVILYHEVWDRTSPDPLAVFLGLSLILGVPAFWADEFRKRLGIPAPPPEKPELESKDSPEEPQP